MDEKFVSSVMACMGFSNPSDVGYHEVVDHFRTFVVEEDPDLNMYRVFPKIFGLIELFGEWMEKRGIFIDDLRKDDCRSGEGGEACTRCEIWGLSPPPHFLHQEEGSTEDPLAIEESSAGSDVPSPPIGGPSIARLRSLERNEVSIILCYMGCWLDAGAEYREAWIQEVALAMDYIWDGEIEEDDENAIAIILNNMGSRSDAGFEPALNRLLMNMGFRSVAGFEYDKAKSFLHEFISVMESGRMRVILTAHRLANHRKIVAI